MYKCYESRRKLIDGLRVGAEFSECREYRYILYRRLYDEMPEESNGIITFIGLNPSTADETMNDPTVTRCMNFARSWEYGMAVVCNIFAYRATDPKVMKSTRGPVGDMNNEYLKLAAKGSDTVVACWGTHGEHLERGKSVEQLIGFLCGIDMYCFGLTKHGYPRHPLYLRSDSKLFKLDIERQI